MTITLNLKPDLEMRLRDYAARTAQEPESLLQQLIESELPLLLSRPTAPPAWLLRLQHATSNELGSVYGKWPDEPNDQELQAELKALQDANSDRN